jgi:hypothetical protein
VLGAAYERAADVGEAVATLEGIRDGDFQSWCDEWERTADRVRGIAESCEDAGRRVSAREAYLRASTYYFQVAF